MADTRLQLTLRDLQRQMGSPTLWVMLAGASLILGISGPFQTFELISTLPRLGYWGLIVVSTYGIGFVITSYAEHAWSRSRSVIGTALVGGVVGLAVGIWILVLNRIAFGPVLDDWQEAAAIIAYGVVISTVILVVLRQVGKSRAQAETAKQADTPALLDRLPLDKRGALVALSVQDHYVEVTTFAGTELVLMRLGDAIRETNGVDGLQVHRSHWVAMHAIRSARRKPSGGGILTLASGRELPISRSFMKDADAAGLFAKGAGDG